MSDDRQEGGEGERKRPFERAVQELLKRVVESGVEKLTEGPENLRHLVGELKVPKEALGHIYAQLDETKNGLYRVVAREIRDVLQQTNLAEEITKVLTTLSFEIRTEIRFVPRPRAEGEAGGAKAREGAPANVLGERDRDEPRAAGAEGAQGAREAAQEPAREPAREPKRGERRRRE